MFLELAGHFGKAKRALGVPEAYRSLEGRQNSYPEYVGQGTENSSPLLAGVQMVPAYKGLEGSD